jgi:hypothetical protein
MTSDPTVRPYPAYAEPQAREATPSRPPVSSAPLAGLPATEAPAAPPGIPGGAAGASVAGRPASGAEETGGRDGVASRACGSA